MEAVVTFLTASWVSKYLNNFKMDGMFWADTPKGNLHRKESSPITHYVVLRDKRSFYTKWNLILFPLKQFTHINKGFSHNICHPLSAFYFHTWVIFCLHLLKVKGWWNNEHILIFSCKGSGKPELAHACSPFIVEKGYPPPFINAHTQRIPTVPLPSLINIATHNTMYNGIGLYSFRLDH